MKNFIKNIFTKKSKKNAPKEYPKGVISDERWDELKAIFSKQKLSDLDRQIGEDMVCALNSEIARKKQQQSQTKKPSFKNKF